MSTVSISIGAFLLTALLHLAALKLFPKINLLDSPERYGHERAPIPYPTGIIAIIVFLGFYGAITPITLQAKGVIAAVALLGIVTFIDDRRRLPSWLRLVTQALCALIIFATGSRIYTLTNPLDVLTGIELLKLDTIDIPSPFGPLPLLSGIFTLAWIWLTTNALNWFDGIPGQVSLLSTIGFSTIGFLSLSSRVDQPELATIAFLLASIATAGLLFDFPPARVLMGDTGAMFFGLMLGVLTIYAGGKVATAFLVLGVPLIDSGIVIVRRLLKRQSPFRGNATDEHLHHRLLAKHWSERQVISLTALLGTLFGVAALFLSTTEKFVAALLLFCVLLSLSHYSKPTKS